MFGWRLKWKTIYISKWNLFVVPHTVVDSWLCPKINVISILGYSKGFLLQLNNEELSIQDISKYFTHISKCKGFYWLVMFPYPLYCHFTEIWAKGRACKCIIWNVTCDHCWRLNVDIQLWPNWNIFKSRAICLVTW